MYYTSAMIEVPYWNTDYGEQDISFVSASIRERCLGQGDKSSLLESAIANLLSTEEEIFVIMVSSGSIALLLSMLALNIKDDDEVIVPIIPGLPLHMRQHCLELRLFLLTHCQIFHY